MEFSHHSLYYLNLYVSAVWYVCVPSVVNTDQFQLARAYLVAAFLHQVILPYCSSLRRSCSFENTLNTALQGSVALRLRRAFVSSNKRLMTGDNLL